MQYCQHLSYFFFFFFNDTATTEIYTLSLHDALPISIPPVINTAVILSGARNPASPTWDAGCTAPHARSLHPAEGGIWEDRKSTRLNSSHLVISYAVFCLKKKKKQI